MSKISNLIFNNAKHTVTSKFGKRAVIQTSAGATSSYHEGVDYGTYGVKLPQYAIEDGYVFCAAKASDGANYVWVIYPRIKYAFLHYHLDSITTKTGATVKKGTELGKTGQTGKATGIHLHLGVRDLKSLTDAQIKKMTWDLLRKCSYVDAEAISYTEAAATSTKTTTVASTKTTSVKLTQVKYDAAQNKDKTVKSKKTLTVNTTAGLHIRTGVNKTSMGVLPYGTKVEWYGYYNTASNGTKWYCVVVNGVTGYCCSTYLK